MGLPQVLRVLLQREVEQRIENRKYMRIKKASFAQLKYLQELVRENLPADGRNLLPEFETLDFIREGFTAHFPTLSVKKQYIWIAILFFYTPHWPMNLALIIIAALLPAFLLIYYINRKDSLQPEPKWQLVKGFLYGVGSCIFIIMLFLILGIGGDSDETPKTFFKAIGDAFLGAAIPEELAKLLMLWLLVRKNKHFNEHMDGIVYAVCIGMGFAGMENILYLFDNIDSWASVGVARALISVPGHFFFAVAMGYFFSLATFGPVKARKANISLMIAAPILMHGIFDSILFLVSVEPALSLVLTIGFFIFFKKIRKFASGRIAFLLAKDKEVAAAEDSMTIDEQ